MAVLHKRQAPGRDIHKHFNLAPAHSHTITANGKAIPAAVVTLVGQGLTDPAPPGRLDRHYTVTGRPLWSALHREGWFRF